MCFSAEVSYATAAVLLPLGIISIYKAYQTDRRYVAICTLPLLFGLQQLFEGFVWTGGEAGDMAAVGRFSLAYMFFSWLAWPVWVPISAFFLEPERRKPLYLGFAVIGAILGSGLYVPYFVHQGWLTVTFLPHAISYGGIETFDFLVSRYFTYLVYVSAVVLPLLIASKREVKIFGILVALVLATTMAFFRYAYVSVFCFGGALMSLYLVGMIFWVAKREAHAPGSGATAAHA